VDTHSVGATGRLIHKRGRRSDRRRQ